jgi:5'(3')-deoxyribonucleotidase
VIKPFVLLDVDGVLADFVTAVFAVVEKIHGQPHGRTVNDIRTWEMFESVPELAGYREDAYARMRLPGACYEIPIMGGAIEGVRRLREIADVHIVTSPFPQSRTWMGERNEWLCRHFDFKEKDITHTHQKELVMGDMLVDDKPSTIEAWEKEQQRKRGPGRGFGFLWHQPHNALVSGLRRLMSWDDLLFHVWRSAEVKQRYSGE